MNEYTIDGLVFHAENCIGGVLINPALPENFDSTPNDERPESHRRWWGRPYITIQAFAGDIWLAAWPGGVRYDVRCLDGGAWDRSTARGFFPTIADAVSLAHWQKEVSK